MTPMIFDYLASQLKPYECDFSLAHLYVSDCVSAFVASVVLASLADVSV